MKKSASFLCLLALAAAGVSAHASTVVYNNAGTDSYGTNAWEINNGYSVANSFSLSSSATIDAISFGDWIGSGVTLNSVAWEITTQANGGTVLGSGTATAFSTVYEGALYGLTVNSDTFGIGSLSLAGNTTYYLELSNAVTAGGYITNWDESNNPNSTPYQYLNGTPIGAPTGSETFALYSGYTATPEPSGLLLMGSGLAGLALIGLMRRRAMAAAEPASCA